MSDNDYLALDKSADSEPESAGTEPTGEVCFFGGDISFGAPEEYDEKPDKVKTLRSVFSLTHLSLFVYLMISQGVATLFTVFSVIVVTAMGGETLGGDFTLVLNIFAQYMIAFPVFLLMTRRIKRREAPRGGRLGAGGFLITLVIAEGIMLVGALLSNLITELIDKLLGGNYGDTLTDVVSGSSLWLVFLSVCILAPVVEEIMFRKIMIDRLSVFGDGAAILFSAVAFGFFHGNLSQIIYATAVGLIFGYVYTRTGKIWHTMLLHAIVNFLGGILPLGIEWLTGEIERIGALPEAESASNASRLLLYELTVSAYGILQILFIVGAVVALTVLIIKRKIQINKEKEIELDNKTVARVGIANAGFILLYGICLLLIGISLVAM